MLSVSREVEGGQRWSRAVCEIWGLHQELEQRMHPALEVERLAQKARVADLSHSGSGWSYPVRLAKSISVVDSESHIGVSLTDKILPPEQQAHPV